jgi:hypothetical protein
MTASRPELLTLDRLVPRLYSGAWPSQPLTAQVSLHTEAVTGTWDFGHISAFGLISQPPRFIPSEEDEEDEGGEGVLTRTPPDDRSYTLTLAPGGRYRLELTSGEDPTLSSDDPDESGDAEDTDDDGTDPWASAVAEPADSAGPGDGTSRGNTPWHGYCGDGTDHWAVYGDRAERTAEPALPAAIRALLWPAWLVSGWDLELSGTAEAAGRTAVRVIATPRPLTRGQHAGRDLLLDRIVLLVDPDLGLPLGHEIIRSGRSDETTLISSLVPGPADVGPAPFRPSPGLPVSDRKDYAEAAAGLWPQMDGPGWRLAKSAAGALGEGLGFAVRHTPRTPPEPGTPPMPDPGPPDTTPAPLPADLVNLLHRTGLPAPRFSATAGTWYDGEGMTAAGQSLRAGAGPMAGLLGPGEVWSALADRPLADRYQAQRVALSLPGRYRVDQLSGLDSKNLRTRASDGERVWAVYPNRVVVLPARVRPLDDRWLRLADPSWLLAPGWQLSAPRPQRVGGRDGWLLWARYTGTADLPSWLLMGQGLLPQICVVADAELGVLLRMTCYADGTPVMCTELFNLTVPPPGADQELFTLSRPDGVPVFHGETMLDELNIPAPLRAAFGAVSRAWRARPPGGPG